jgi:hypothetical protein
MNINNSNIIHVKLQINDEFRRFFVEKDIKFEELCLKISSVLSLTEEQSFTIKYKDDEQEWITISSDNELETGLVLSDKMLRLCVDLLNMGGVTCNEVANCTTNEDNIEEDSFVPKWKRYKCGKNKGRRGGRGRGRCGKRGKGKWKKFLKNHDESTSDSASENDDKDEGGMNFEEIKNEIRNLKSEKRNYMTDIQVIRTDMQEIRTSLVEAKNKGEDFTTYKQQLANKRSEITNLQTLKKNCVKELRQLKQQKRRLVIDYKRNSQNNQS